MKQEKGITIVSLVVMIVILIIVASVGIKVSTPLIGRANIQDISTELMLIQAKWKIEREKVNFDGTSTLAESGTINTEGTVENGKGKLKDDYIYIKNGEEWVEGGTQYYKLPKEALDSMGLEKLNAEDGYIVNYDNDEIIYLKGVEKDGRTYYKLSEIKGL